MKNIFNLKNTTLTILMTMILGGFYAFGQSTGILNEGSMNELITTFTPFIVYGGTWLARKYLGIKNLNGMFTLLVVGLLSIGIPLVQDYFTDDTIPYLARVGLGLASVFLNEFKNKLTATKVEE